MEKKMKTAKCYLLFFWGLFWTFSLLAQQPEEAQIFQTDKKIVIDGNLDEWSASKELPVDSMPDGKKLAPSADLGVTARFTFDAENFYAAVRAVDDRPEFPERDRRSSDGFLLTFTDPSKGNESDRFLTFGFSMRGKEEVKVLLNRNGESFLQNSIGDVQLKIVVDSVQKSIIYEVGIPWKYIPGFRPFLQQKWGVNLIYIDYDGGQRKVVQLFPDPNYDTELSNKRKAVVFRFIPHLPEVPEFQALLVVNHFYEDQEKKISLAVNSPSAFQDWEVRFIISSPDGNMPSKKSLSFEKGMNILSLPIDSENHPSGLYDLSLGILDDKGALKYTENAQFFQLNKKEFEALESKVADVKKGDLFLKDAIFRESLPALEIRLQWIKQLIEDPAPFADLESLQQWNGEMKELFKIVDEGKPALFPPGRMARLAYRSEIDNSLQPYSVLVPDNYDQKKSFPLLVTLHTGGVDDRGAMASMAFPYYGPRSRKSEVDFIILAPLARGVFDPYVGDSAREVIECIGHLKKLYNIEEKRIAIDGFSMGGYEAWRISLLNPEMFKAVIVRSGRTSLPDSGKGENIFDLLDRRTALNFLIIHGDQDEISPVEDVRKAVARMQELKMKVKYIEVKGAGHGDYNKWPDILSWLKEVLQK
jgi:predicted esterase